MSESRASALLVASRGMAASLIAGVCGFWGYAGQGWPPARGGTPESSATQPASRQATASAPVGRDLHAGTVVCLGGAKVALPVQAEPGRSVTWHLAYQEKVLCSGQAKSDANGVARVELTAPDVRHRAPCLFVAKADAGLVRREMVILPKSILAGSTSRLRELNLGVADSTGRVQERLRGEGVEFDDLKTDTAEDTFTGGAVVLSGYQSAESLEWTCRKLEGRVRAGISVLILNPPAGWSGYGVRQSALARPMTGSVRLAEGFGAVLRGEDLGAGPWATILDANADFQRLAWVAPAQSAAKGDRAAQHPLIVAGRAGQGWVLVAQVPSLNDPVQDAAGASLLDEAILWVLGKRPQDHSKE